MLRKLSEYDERFKVAGSVNDFEPPTFIQTATSIASSVLKKLIPSMITLGLWSILVVVIDMFVYRFPKVSITPTELFGAAIGILIVFRTNAGHDRWWEARKVWGGIVNQCRNYAIAALAYGPKDTLWREHIIESIAAFPYSVKDNLRDLPYCKSATRILEHEIAATNGLHMPSIISMESAVLNEQAHSKHQISELAFFKLEEERSKLIDYTGKCERIKSTPMPLAYAIEVRRILLLFLILAPMALVGEVGIYTPLVLLLTGYPFLALDQIGQDLQSPFALESVSHLPLDNICQMIEKNLSELLVEANKDLKK